MGDIWYLLSTMSQSKLEVITLGADVLRKTASNITEFNSDLSDFIEDMINTMMRYEGIGLAAPQVGKLSNVFVCQIPGSKPQVFINPEIIGTSQEQVPYEEGCLSIPSLYGDVIRPEKISIQGYNLKGRPFKIDAEGLLARVIQHEMDHLKGILFIDYIDEKKREKLLKEYHRNVKV
jgi:peptide deformylase